MLFPEFVVFGIGVFAPVIACNLREGNVLSMSRFCFSDQKPPPAIAVLYCSAPWLLQAAAFCRAGPKPVKEELASKIRDNVPEPAHT